MSASADNLVRDPQAGTEGATVPALEGRLRRPPISPWTAVAEIRYVNKRLLEMRNR